MQIYRWHFIKECVTSQRKLLQLGREESCLSEIFWMAVSQIEITALHAPRLHAPHLHLCRALEPIHLQLTKFNGTKISRSLLMHQAFPISQSLAVVKKWKIWVMNGYKTSSICIWYEPMWWILSFTHIERTNYLAVIAGETGNDIPTQFFSNYVGIN